jgi:hypothetical protein
VEEEEEQQQQLVLLRSPFLQAALLQLPQRRLQLLQVH